MNAVGSFATSVNSYQTAQCHILDDSNLWLHQRIWQWSNLKQQQQTKEFLHHIINTYITLRVYTQHVPQATAFFPTWTLWKRTQLSKRRGYSLCFYDDGITPFTYWWCEALRWSRGSVLAFGTQVRGFKPGRSRQIFQGEKKNPQHASLPKGSKAVCPMSQIYGIQKIPEMLRGSRAFSGKPHRPFFAQVVPPFTTKVSGGNTWRCK